MDCVVAALYFTPGIPHDEALLRLKAGLNSLGSYHGEPLQPIEHQREAWEQNQADLLHAGMILTHGPLAYEAGARQWSIVLDHRRFEADNLSVLQLEVPLIPRDMKGLGRAWRFAVHAAPRLVHACEPSFACVALLDADLPEQAHMRPLPADLPPLELPAFFTPWTYLSEERLTIDRREALAALPAAVTRPLGYGWVTQAVEHLGQEVGPEFFAALAALPSWTETGYKQARLD